MRQAFLRPFLKKVKSDRLVSVDDDPELDELEALEDEMNETPSNCADDDEDEEATDEQDGWVIEEDEEADDTLPPLEEDMEAVDEVSHVELVTLKALGRKDAVGLLTKVSVLYQLQRQN